MTEFEDISKAKQIRALLYVVVSGIIAATVLSLSMLYYYNPSGSYLAKNVLLTPDLAFASKAPEAGTKVKKGIAFDHIDFTYYDPLAKTTKIVKVDQEQYSRFYDLVKDEISINDADEAVQSRFNLGHPAALTLKLSVNNEGTSKGVENIFSEVDFADNSDYFRVKLRQQGSAASYAYFYFPGIYQKAINILTVTP